MCPEKKLTVKQKKNSLNSLLVQYGRLLETLKENPGHLLPTLLHRDKVNSELKELSDLKSTQADELLKLDKKLKEMLREIPLVGMEERRDSLNPGATSWWWSYDKEQEFGMGRNFIWALIAGTLFILTTALALEIIKRFWEGAPDSVSVVGSLIVVFITSSPFFKQGQDFTRLILKQIKLIKPKYQTQAMAGMALIAFVLILVARVWGVKSLSLYYNNRGFSDLHEGNVTNAQQAFRRASSLNPDTAVPYQNLADVYQQIGLLENAASWYQRAIEQDINFTPAYGGLGHLYNIQGEYAQAELILLAGLNINLGLKDKALNSVTQYQLLSNLGWAYFEQGKNDLVIIVLKEAIAFEPELKELGESIGVEYRTAIPHFFLAQSYELLGQTEDAQSEWDESLRYLDPNNWKEKEWLEITLSHLK